ncbi:MAG: DUF4886 domain-containing protein [Chloroflexota bacterium]
MSTVVAIGLAAALVVAAVVAALTVTGRLALPGHCAPQGTGPCTRVLFIGNSYTYVNDLPGTFAEVARSGGRDVEVGMAAIGGATLGDHVASSATQGALAAQSWDVVVLQEQSQLPAVDAFRIGGFDPAVRSLVKTIHSAGARPLLFATWAHRDGWPEERLNDYASMQDRIDAAYVGIGRELGVGVAPVGAAWAAVRASDPGIDLWQPDGSHPSAAGTYLAACVFYAAIFGESPVGLGGRGGLPAETARALQQAAAAVVPTDPARDRYPSGPGGSPAGQAPGYVSESTISRISGS